MAISAEALSIVPLHACLGARVEGVDLTAAAVRRRPSVASPPPSTSSRCWSSTTSGSPTRSRRPSASAGVPSRTPSCRRARRPATTRSWWTSPTPTPITAASWTGATAACSTIPATSSGTPTAPSSRCPRIPPRCRAARCRPVGGETEFASMRHAWADLPDDVKARLEGKVAVHSIIYSRNLIAKDLFDPAQAAALPAVRHALVRANPANGRKTFYIGSHAWFIEGLPYAREPAPPRRAARPDHRAGARLPARVEAVGPRDVGQPLRAAPRPALGLRPVPAHHAAHDGGGRRPHRGPAPRGPGHPARPRAAEPPAAEARDRERARDPMSDGLAEHLIGHDLAATAVPASARWGHVPC